VAPHFEERLLGYIKRAEQRTQAEKASVLRPFGLTPAQQNVLAVVNDQPGITSAELARRVTVTPQTITSTVARLEEQGLVLRTPHLVHRTLIELTLTETGQKLFAQADAAVAAYDEELTQRLSTAEVVTLKRLLDELVAGPEPSDSRTRR
jgi:DNA-binding MarR family transcriptional regulator